MCLIDKKKLLEENIERYRNSQIFKKKYDRRKNNRITMKERELETYSSLLYFCTRKNIKGGTLLDTGSADGAFEEACKKNNVNCTSVDISTGINFEIDSFPFQGDTFDYINSNSVIEHLYNPTNYLNEIHRILKPGGYLFVVTPHWPYAWREFYNTYTHVRPYSYKSLNEVLIAHGFQVMALVPWLVHKSIIFWKLPKPFSFLAAKYLIPFSGEVRLMPKLLKGRSSTLLCLAQKPNIRQKSI